jgi:hypothetical protein
MLVKMKQLKYKKAFQVLLEVMSMKKKKNSFKYNNGFLYIKMNRSCINVRAKM